MKVVTIIGTRPNFNKSMLITKAFAEKGIEEIVVHTGQHYDKNMSDIFFEECELPPPKYKFELVGVSEHEKIAELVVKIKEVLEREKPDVTLVYGDVNSTMAGAIASAKLRIPVAHIESGIRDPDLYNAEEINRRVTDTLSDVLFASTRESYQNLINEKFSPEKVYFTGDIMMDSLMHIVKKHEINVETGDYTLVTIHRQENTENKRRLKSILSAVSRTKERIVFPMHPRTRNKIEENNLGYLLEKGNVEVLPPQGFIGFTKLVAGSRKILTDSGGVRREGYMLKKPVIIPIGIVWFPEIVDAGWATIIADADEERILNSLDTFSPPLEHPEIFGNGNAHEKIIELLLKHYG